MRPFSLTADGYFPYCWILLDIFLIAGYFPYFANLVNPRCTLPWMTGSVASYENSVSGQTMPPQHLKSSGVHFTGVVSHVQQRHTAVVARDP